MDYIEGLAKQASQLTMYDVKSYYNQAKNMVLNVSETEAKVREATNDDPWGASTTLMQQIADGTHNFTQFNEIMPTIYSRFMEKEAREWRQIYKALTLLEYLVKNGSERVVDDARAHVSTIKMLRSFHYIDEKGKDQGINVRNRAGEVAALLGDVDRIRQERRKAKSNRTKYSGQGGGGGMSFITAGGSKYGGFGSEDLAGGRGGGGGGGSGWNRDYDTGDDYRGSRGGFNDRTASAEYDEYEGADDFDDQPPRRTGSSSNNHRQSSRPQVPPKSAPKAPEKPKEKPKEVNLFDFDDDPVPAPATAASAAPVDLTGGDDDFDDFQSAPNLAPTTTTSAPAPKPAQAANANLFDMLNSSAPSAPALAPTQTMSSMSPQHRGMMSPTLNQPVMSSRPSYTTAPPSTTSINSASAGKAPSPKPTSGSTFDDLWTTSLTSAGGQAKSTAGAGSNNKTIKDLEKEKAMDKLWGSTPSAQPAATAAPTQTQAAAKPSGGFDDLLI